MLNSNVSDKIHSIISSILTSDILEKWKSFMEDHSSEFLEDEKNQISDSSKFSLNSTTLYNEFSSIIEERFSKVIVSYDMTEDEFYKACSETTDEDELVSTFLEILNISLNFELFVDVMRDETKRAWMFSMLDIWSRKISESEAKT